MVFSELKHRDWFLFAGEIYVKLIDYGYEYNACRFVHGDLSFFADNTEVEKTNMGYFMPQG